MRTERATAVLETGKASLHALFAEYQRWGHAPDVLEYRFQQVMASMPRGTPRWTLAVLSGYWQALLAGSASTGPRTGTSKPAGTP